jgi:capsular polysaccharide biosynthesis protein
MPEPSAAGADVLFVVRGKDERVPDANGYERRHLENSEEVIAAVRTACSARRVAFLVAQPGEKMNISEQMSTFREAKVIVGIHGAALANALFARHPKCIVELPPIKEAQDFPRMVAGALAAEKTRLVRMDPRHVLHSNATSSRVSPEAVAEAVLSCL